jgi:hypothetical protein
MPPSAAAMGSAACRGLASSPMSSSRLISSPTTKKKTAMSPSLIQWWSDSVSPNPGAPTVTSVSHRWK